MTVMVVIPLELLRPQQSVGEVDHEPHGDEGGERIIEDHGRTPLKLVAGDRVAHRQRKEAEPDGQHDDVQHGGLLIAREIYKVHKVLEFR
jgi:hypothetical protein